MAKTAQEFQDAIAQAYSMADYATSLCIAQAGLASHPHHAMLWQLHGIIHDAMGDTSSAIESLETATTLAPLSAAGRCVLAGCYLNIGYRDLARDMFQFLLSSDGLPDQLLPLIAAGFGRLNEFELALESCRRAAESDPDSGEPFYGMAYYMQQLDYPPQLMVNVLGKALNVEPGQFRYQLALAKLLSRLGRFREAYEAVRDVSREHLDSIQCRNCLLSLATIYVEAGDHGRRDICRSKLFVFRTRDDQID